MFEKGVLDLRALSESSEFDTKAKNGDPDNHVDDPNVSIPGGLKEQPTKDAIVMTTKEYDDARAKLKQSFKECGAMMDMLSTVKVVNENGEQQTGGRITMNELYKEYLMGYAESGITEPPVTFEEFVERVSGGVEIDESADDVMKEAYSDYLMQFAESGIDESPCSFTEFIEAVNGVSSITEATRLAKEIHKKIELAEESDNKIGQLKKLLKQYDKGTPEYKLIQKKIDDLKKNDGTIQTPGGVKKASRMDSLGYGRSKSKERHYGSVLKRHQQDAFDTKPASGGRKKDSLGKLGRELKAVGESVSADEFLEMYVKSIMDDEE